MLYVFLIVLFHFAFVNLFCFAYEPKAFNRILCGVAWVNSTANKEFMFFTSRGFISMNVCKPTGATAAAPNMIPRETVAPIRKPIVPICRKCGRNKVSGNAELQRQSRHVFNSHHKAGNCSDGPHGPIEMWDISCVTDMFALFF